MNRIRQSGDTITYRELKRRINYKIKTLVVDLGRSIKLTIAYKFGRVAIRDKDTK